MNKVFSTVPESADPNGGGWGASTWKQVHPYQEYKTGPVAGQGVTMIIPRGQDPRSYNPHIGFDNPEASIGFNLHSRLNPIVRRAATATSDNTIPAYGDMEYQKPFAEEKKTWYHGVPGYKRVNASDMDYSQFGP